MSRNDQKSSRTSRVRLQSRNYPPHSPGWTRSWWSWALPALRDSQNQQPISVNLMTVCGEPLSYSLCGEGETRERNARVVRKNAQCLLDLYKNLFWATDYTHSTSTTVCVRLDGFSQWVETSKPHTGEGNRGFVKASTAIGVAKWTAQLDMCVWGTARDHT